MGIGMAVFKQRMELAHLLIVDSGIREKADELVFCDGIHDSWISDCFSKTIWSSGSENTLWSRDRVDPKPQRLREPLSWQSTHPSVPEVKNWCAA